MKHWFIALILGLLSCQPAFAQGWNTVPNHGLGVGRGPGFGTPNPVGPCAANNTIIWGGTTSDPVCYNLNGVVTNVATNAALRALVPTSIAYRAGFYAAGDGGAMTYTFSSTPCTLADNGAQVSSTAATGCWTAIINGASVNVLVWGAQCGASDSTTFVLASIAGLFALTPRSGGTLIISCLITMNGALAIPFTGTAPPQQPPLRITGLGAASWDSTLNGQSTPGGGVLNILYTGGDGMHPAKIDTRGTGILEIDHLKIEDTGGSNFLMLQSTNTTIRTHDNHWVGNTACTGTNCAQDMIQFGGITSASSVLGGVLATNGFQGYGSSSINDTFSYCRHAFNFGGSANSISIINIGVDFTCGSAEVTGAPIVFYGVGIQVIANVIWGGFVEMGNYHYAVAFRDDGTSCVTGGSYQNSIIGLAAGDNGGSTVGYAYFQDACDQNFIQPGYFAATAGNILNGPGRDTQTLVAQGRYLGMPYFSDGGSVARTVGNGAVLAFGKLGIATSLLLNWGVGDAGTGRGAIYSGTDVVGTITGNLLTLSYPGHIVAMAVDLTGNIGIAGGIHATTANFTTSMTTGNATVGNGTGAVGSIINAGASGNGNGAYLLFQNNGASNSAIGNLSAILGGATPFNLDLLYFVGGTNNHLFYTQGAFKAILSAAGGFNIGTNADPGAGIINAANGYKSGGTSGLSVTTTVRASGGAADCTLIFVGGIRTGGSC